MNKILRMMMAGLVMMGGANQAMAECFDIKGKVLTSTINPTTQLGTIEISGEAGDLEGAILGLITGNNTSTLPIITYLDHTIVFPGKGRVVTRNDVAELTPVKNDACKFKVKERLNIITGTGKFSGASGTGTALGSVNFCTGDNKFFISISLCTNP